jgi:hypothetical protein
MLCAQKRESCWNVFKNSVYYIMLGVSQVHNSYKTNCPDDFFFSYPFWVNAGIVP